jgi:hypothetical protein
MYGDTSNPVMGRFGLSCGQIRANREKITHFSGWFNHYGENLGCGDMSSADFNRIAAEIEGDEMFILLSHADSTWKMRHHTTLHPRAPGIDYVAEHCNYFIVTGQVCIVSPERRPEEREFTRDKVKFKVLTRDETKSFLVTRMLAAS